MKNSSLIKLIVIVALIFGIAGQTEAVPQRDVIGYWTIDLQPGFNLVAFPVLPDTPTLSAVIGDRLGAVELTTWDSRIGGYRWARFDPDSDQWSGNLYILDRGRAYWINLLEAEGEMSIRVTGHPEVYTRFEWRSLGTGWKYYGPTIGKDQNLREVSPTSANDILLRFDHESGKFNLAQANERRHWISSDFTVLAPDEGYLVHQMLRQPRVVGPITELEYQHQVIENLNDGDGPPRDDDPGDGYGDYLTPPRPLIVGNSNNFPICLPNGDVCETEYSVEIVRQTFRLGADGELEPVVEFMATYVINGGGIEPGKFVIPITVSDEPDHVQVGDRVYIHVNGPGGSTTRSATFEIPEYDRFIPDLVFPEFLRSDDISIPVPVEFSLGAPYPNPFNDRFTVQFSLPETGDVKYRLYNLNGREVYSRQLPLSQGVHTLSISANNLPAGIYLFEISSQERRGIVKIAHLK
jgi:hypothetical protein